jgi:D-alanyl-D-alanine carboxypeptidase/D-alanyl-D-alanine-endopeptidase (penicillin-binding protein 4)
VDGSLRKRLKDSDGRIHAKTGTMRGIRALAGYVDSNTGPRFAFAVVFNGYPGGSAPYKAIQDRVCRVLADAADLGVTSR